MYKYNNHGVTHGDFYAPVHPLMMMYTFIFLRFWFRGLCGKGDKCEYLHQVMRPHKFEVKPLMVVVFCRLILRRWQSVRMESTAQIGSRIVSINI
jgi:hypothetical protein